MAHRKLGRPSDQRVALLRNQVTNLIWYGKIETTLQRAKEDLKEGLYDVLVQAPVVSSNKPDTEDKSLLVLFSNDIRIAFVTNHLPIKEVAQNITREKIEEKARLFHKSL